MSATARPHEPVNVGNDDDVAATPTARSHTFDDPHAMDSMRPRVQLSAESSRPRGKAQGEEEEEDEEGTWDHHGAAPGDTFGQKGETPARAAAKERVRAQLAAAASAYAYQVTKMKHLKKEDGIPLWRKDIQYDLLRHVLYDETKCFTKFSEGTGNHTFAEVYIDAMAKSSKCSKVLRDKLLQDQHGAIIMAMVCLLVNIGRMNTTLNFFPEMRAQLRTYHSIPALQARQDPTSYKQLQDAPRLKSILKGATEDTPQPSTIEDIRNAPKPRTNVVNLIFVMNQYCPKITELHFPGEQDFFDLIMKTDTSSKSRAKAFLWLMWWYLESDFTYEDSQRNPFGPGEFGEGDRDTDPLAVKVPALMPLTEEEEAAENVDTEEEIKFGEDKQRERAAILASEPSPAMTAIKRPRKDKLSGPGHYDDEGSEAGWGDLQGPRLLARASGLHNETASEFTRSPSPGGGRGMQGSKRFGGDLRHSMLDSDDVAPEPSPPRVITPIVRKGPGRGNWRRKNKAGLTRAEVVALANSDAAMQDGSHMSFEDWEDSPRSNRDLNASFSLRIGKRELAPTPSSQAQKRTRGMTQHQSAVVNHRKQQIDYSLDQRIRRAHTRAREKRENESAIVRAWKRIRTMPSDYDSDEESLRIRSARERSEKDTNEWRSSAHRNKDHDAFLDNADLWRRPRMLYAGFVRVPSEQTDVGEEAKSLAQSIRRVSRRLERWQEITLPGHIIIRRRGLEAQGQLTKLPPRRTVTADDIVIEIEDPELPVYAAPTASRGRGRGGRQRGGLMRGKGRRELDSGTRDSSKVEMDLDPDEDDGAAELDEEDREILGEVDADESEDEDDDMDD